MPAALSCWSVIGWPLAASSRACPTGWQLRYCLDSSRDLFRGEGRAEAFRCSVAGRSQRPPLRFTNWIPLFNNAASICQIAAVCATCLLDQLGVTFASQLLDDARQGAFERSLDGPGSLTAAHFRRCCVFFEGRFVSPSTSRLVDQNSAALAHPLASHCLPRLVSTSRPASLPSLQKLPKCCSVTEE